MCQFAAYLGVEAPLSTLLYDAPRSLEVLSYDPRDQVAGRVNVDGTGIAWWQEGERMPMRYVTVQPPWSDPNLPSLARRLRGRAHLAAVRSATPGIPIGPGNVHPFEYSRHAFAHQGVLGRFREATGRPLLQALPDGLHAAIDAVSDSLVLFLTVMRHLDASGGEGVEEAVVATLRDALAVASEHRAHAALNVITCDGERIVATRCARGRRSSPLHVLEGAERWPGGRLVATEPLDDDAAWREVPDDHLVVVDDAGVRITPLALGSASSPLASTVRITRVEGSQDYRQRLAADARAGLSSSPKWLPPRYFYDARGSHLFESITRLPEYYLTRTEEGILERIADEVVELAQPEELLELGSGSSRKTRVLLEAMRRTGRKVRYVAVDVSEEALRQAAALLTARYSGLEVHGIVGDFEDLRRVLAPGPRRLVAFLGSTVGNLDPDERLAFFGAARRDLKPEDSLLLGVDLVKDERLLHAAYNDSAGVTDQFNLNVLRVLNRELGADFPLDAFAHVARWVPEASRMEMFLRALRPLEVTLPALELTVSFALGEELRTEISCKFTRAGVTAELEDAGLRVARWDADDAEQFAVLLARPA